MLPGRTALAAAPAVVLFVLGAWETCATREAATSVPGDPAWDEAAATVRARYAAGDLIVFAPDWVDPVGRLHLGDLIPLEMAGRMDAARYGRIWELSIRGAHAPEVVGLTPVTSGDYAGVRVRLFERPAATVTADVLEHVTDARADGPLRPGLVFGEVGFAPHRCVQIVPHGGTPVRITFPQLALGTELVGYVGLADVFTRRDVRTPVELDVEIGGKLVASAKPGVDDGWVRFAAPTTPGPTDVVFIARAAESNRLVCFAAEARK